MKPIHHILLIAVMNLVSCALAQTGPSGNMSAADGDQPAHLGQATVVATNVLQEELLMGDNKQPEWTARRRFITTRVYVQPPWQFEAEFGYDGSFGNVGKPMHLLQQEIELGLPYRFQVDFENVFQNFKEGDDETRKWKHESNSIEVRYAFADWGRIFLNPTVNLEWRFNDGAADAAEVNLLLGEEFGKGLHWGLNLFYEQQIGDDRIREFAFSQGLSYTLIDQKLSAGVEMKFSSESDKDSRSDPENKFQIGPSFQWRPTRRTHLDIVPLFGCTSASPTAEVFIFFGFEFGKGSKEPEGVSPASLRGK
jgi:hypothetical protein